MTVETSSRRSAKDTGPVRRFVGSRVTFAVLLLALAALLLKDRFIFEPAYAAVHDEYRSILLDTQKMAEEKASEAQWSAFAEDVDKRVSPFADEMYKLSEHVPANNTRANDTLNHFVRRPLHRIGKYDLPRLIKQARSGQPIDNAFARIEADLVKVNRALEVIRMGSQPKEEQGRR